LAQPKSLGHACWNGRRAGVAGLGSKPLRVKALIDGKELPVEADYHGRMRIRVNDLVLDLQLKPSTLEVDLRGFSLNPQNLRLLFHILQPTLTFLESEKSSHITLKIYGITLKLRRR
jgi:hypothetical protein